MVFENGSGGDFLCAFAIAPRFLGVVQHMFIHAVFLCTNPFHMFLSRHMKSLLNPARSMAIATLPGALAAV
jgi:hypothetical protein